MRTLELFSGTQSFSKGIKRLDAAHDCVTVDILPKFRPSIRANILTWNYKVFPPGHFDIIWCSPPCTEYSTAKTIGVRDLESADACVRACWEIIDYFQPATWILENPQTGLLSKRMLSLRPDAQQFYDADYCAYGKPYRKRTRFWTNFPCLDLRLCTGEGSCPQMVGNKHLGNCGGGRVGDGQLRFSVWEKDAIPERLIDYLIQAATSATVLGSTATHSEH